MSDMMTIEIEVATPQSLTARSRPLRRWIGAVTRRMGSAIEWIFGLISLIVCLSTLAALPILQFLTMGYMLESSARVARTGRFRDGFIGVRKAARIGSTTLGIWISLLPLWLVGSFAQSAQLIDPGGSIAHRWRVALIVMSVVTIAHVLASCLRGGRLRHFLWPFGNPFWLVRGLRRGGLYAETRDRFWEFLVALRPLDYFRLGLLGFLGTLLWLIVPATMIAMTSRFPVVGVIGLLILGVIAPSLLFLQVHYALEGRFSAMFARRVVRDRFRRAPWAFAFALLVLLVSAIPLYLLKIEMVPREAAWLPSLVFVLFLAPARLLAGWAYARSSRRERPRHWFFRIVGRLAILPPALLYVAVVFFAQYTSWGGVASLYEQHAFLLPVPFLSM